MKGIGVKLRILKKKLPIVEAVMFSAVAVDTLVLFRCAPDQDTSDDGIQNVRTPTGEKWMELTVFA